MKYGRLIFLTGFVVMGCNVLGFGIIAAVIHASCFWMFLLGVLAGLIVRALIAIYRGLETLN